MLTYSPCFSFLLIIKTKNAFLKMIPLYYDDYYLILLESVDLKKNMIFRCPWNKIKHIAVIPLCLLSLHWFKAKVHQPRYDGITKYKGNDNVNVMI